MANIRLFLPGAGQDPGAKRWRELAFQYVSEMVRQDLQVLCLATPFVNLNETDLFYPLRHLFTGRLISPYVNVVFGLNKIVQGNVLTGLKRMQGLTNAKRGLEAGPDDLEEPTAVTELVRLWTAGVNNVAMIGSWPRELTAEEIDVLGRYDLVCSPETDVTNVTYRLVDATEFAVLLRKLIND